MVREVVEAVDIRYRSWYRPVEDLFNVARVWRGAVVSEDVTKESRSCLEELTFCDIEYQIRFR